MRGRKPEGLAILKNVRPGGGRTKHVHTLTPMLAAPDHLDAEEKAVFETIRENSPAGLLAQIDRFLLEAFAQHVILHRRALRELNELTFDTETTKRAHPLVAIANDQVKILLAASEALGLTAPARQRLKLPNVDPAAWAEWDDVPGLSALSKSPA
jgi:P27 family predicted phage terminase small subunit